MGDRKPQSGGVWGGVLPPQRTPSSDEPEQPVQDVEFEDVSPVSLDEDVPTSP